MRIHKNSLNVKNIRVMGLYLAIRGNFQSGMFIHEFLIWYVHSRIFNLVCSFTNFQSGLFIHEWLNREFTKILLLSETYRRLIGDPSETDLPHRRPIGDRHASSETDMPHRRPTCFIGDRHASSETHKKYISCLTQSSKLLYFTPLIHISY